MQVDTGWQNTRQVLQEAVLADDAAGAIRSAQELLTFGRPADLAYCATAFKKLHSSLAAYGHKSLKVFLIRSVTVEPILPALYVEAALHGYLLEIRIGGYGSYMSELMNADQSLKLFSPDLVCVLLDLEDVAGDLSSLVAQGRNEELAAEVLLAEQRILQMLRAFRSESHARIVLQGFVLPTVTSAGIVGEANVDCGLLSSIELLNTRLKEVCRSVPSCVFCDVDKIAGNFGRDRWRDERMFLATRLPLAPAAFRSFANALVRSASALLRPARKVLCTDLDNTLWGGVLGEEGPTGIATGASFPGNCYLVYQRYLKALAARGILLAICSKNNETDVVEAFEVRASDLAIGLKDFVATKISWDEKVKGIRELAAELSLGLDSFVFVDDNPTECEAVRRNLPEVAVIQVHAQEPWRMTNLLSDQWLFDALSVTLDDRHRTEEYKAQSLRATLAENATSNDEFLASLDIVCTFVSAADAPLDRSVQLLGKTNQFNLTTRRHTATEVLEFVKNAECQAVAVRVRDRFGDAGVVGLALTRQRGEVCTIDSFLLSCRVIGRGIESAILAHLARRAALEGARWLLGEFIETKKNAPCKNFYPEHGFEIVPELSTTGSTTFRLDLAKNTPDTPSWLKVEGKQVDELGYRTTVAS